MNNIVKKNNINPNSKMAQAINRAHEKLDKGIYEAKARAEKTIDTLQKVKGDIDNVIDVKALKTRVMNKVVNSRKYRSASPEKQAAAKKKVNDTLAHHLG